MRRLSLLLILLLTPAAASPADTATANPGPSVLVKAAPMKRGSVADTLTVYGTVVPDATASVAVSFAQPGQISRLRVVPGQLVKRGAPLIELSTNPLAAAAYQRAQAALEFARGELRRVGSLAAHRLATRSQVALARKNLADAEAELAAQRRLGAERRRAIVKAPFTALVMSVRVHPGERVAAGTPLMQLARAGRLQARLGLEPEDAVRVKAGMPVHLVSVFGNATVDARVSRVHHVVNPHTRLVDVLVSLDGTPADGLMSGMQVRGTITLAGGPGWVVPRSAVLRDARGAYLYQISGDHARRVDVRAGGQTDRLVAVSGSFNPRLRVVVQGNYELKDGMAVREKAK